MEASQTKPSKSSKPGRRGVKGTSTTNAPRRSKAAIRKLKTQLLAIISELHPATVRQIYYQATVRGLGPKTEAFYRLVCRMLTQMRREGLLPFSWIADNTRWQRKPRTWGSLTSMLELTQQTYRRAIWADQDAYVEIWLEKEALSGVLVSVTAEWDVPLMVTKGYPSVSFLYSAAIQIAAIDKPTFIYYFGDHDPSGVDIDRFVEQELRRYAPEAEITFERAAVLKEQILQYELPTRPTKQSDSRSRKFKGESVEVDAIHPHTLRELCAAYIEGHIDPFARDATLKIEEAERETLARLAAQA